MTAADLMTRTFEVVHPDTLLEHVVVRSDQPENGPLLVCEHGRLIGILDTREVAAAKRQPGAVARAARVRDVVAPDVLYCLESTDVTEAAALMREHDAPVIPVLGPDRRLVGLVSLKDVPLEAEPSPARNGGDEH
ncbi:MAG TPA: CBS domain-containing protein [Candidatus Eisenbacteria bacterium]|nr:CBS domain-containing protein [Candidatus Eisenbacteria bacterium]